MRRYLRVSQLKPVPWITPINSFFEHIMQRSHGSKHYAVSATLLSCVLLAACASHAPPKVDQAKVKQFVGQGYLTDDHYGIATTFATWNPGGNRLDVALTVPSKPGPLALVIYLPALGESRTAGDEWRKAWAESGYAVISVQPLADDATALSSARARAGDFAALAHERYSAKTMIERIAGLRGALAEVVRRHDSREPPFDRMDLTRVAVAGYDLGAYTAMVIAGESIRDFAPPLLPITIKAVIALSPYADFSGVSLAQRYAAVHGPVLSITSDNDVDPLTLVTSPSLRKAPFEYMPRGQKYLVTLSDISHRTLAGSGIKEEAQPSPESTGGSGSSPQREGSGSGRRRGSGSMGGSGEARKGGAGRSGSAGATQLSPTVQAIGVTIVQGVTTAFLDAYVKDDGIAREWLDKDAARWIRDSGEIKKK